MLIEYVVFLFKPVGITICSKVFLKYLVLKPLVVSVILTEPESIVFQPLNLNQKRGCSFGKIDSRFSKNQFVGQSTKYSNYRKLRQLNGWFDI